MDDLDLGFLPGINVEPEIVFRENTHAEDKGYKTETRFQSLAADHGIETFWPRFHATKVDCIARKTPEKTFSVQIKTAWLKPNGTYKFPIGTHSSKNYSPETSYYKSGDFDIMAAYMPDIDVFAFYFLDDICGKSSFVWKPRNGQAENNWEIFF